MKTTQSRILVLLLAVVLLLSAWPALAARPTERPGGIEKNDIDIAQIVADQGTTAAESADIADVEVAAEPLWVPPSAAPGFYAARDWRNIDKSTHGIVGGHQSFYWDQLNPAEGVYNWGPIESFLDAEIAAGKKAAFGIVTFNGRANEGRDTDPPLRTPAWVFAAGAAKIICPGNPDAYKDKTIPDGQPQPDPRYYDPPAFEIPKYWNSVYKAKYTTFVNALGAKYDGDPRVEYIQIGIGKFGETQPCDDRDDAYVRSALQADGKTDWTWAYIVKDELVPIYDNAFSTTRLVLPNAPTFGNDKGGFKLWTDDAIARGIGLFPAGLLAIQENIDYRTRGTDWNGVGKFDQILTHISQFEAGTASEQWVPLSQEAYNYMTPTAVEFYWAVLAALHRRIDYVTVENDVWYSGDTPRADFADYVSVMQWATQYMGKSLAQSPSAWVALREDGYPDGNPWWPQAGNYSWFMYQDDSVPGGATVPTTYRARSKLIYKDYYTTYGDAATRASIEVDQTFLGGATGTAREGWMTRRTNQATGNTIMGFKISDRFAYNTPTTAVITVRYFDRGTDSWRLIYDATSDANKVAGTITKGNTNTWKTAVFTVPDALFANRGTGSTDLRIDCMSDGNEYIHMVNVSVGASAVTPTPTQTTDPNVTVSATPSPTPSTTPTLTSTPTRTLTPSLTPLVTPTPVVRDVSPVQDTWLNSAIPAETNGTSHRLKVRYGFYNTLMRFDLSSVPTNSTVSKATLYMYLDEYEHAPTISPEVWVYKVLSDWDQTQASWRYRLTGTMWDAPGASGSGDRSSLAYGSTTVSTIRTWYSWDITNLVQEWVWDPGTNRGMEFVSFMLRELRFNSSDYPTNKPYLHLEYTTGGDAPPTSTPQVSPTATPFTGPSTSTDEFRGAGKDTYLDIASPSTNNENHWLHVYGPGWYRSLLDFDVSSKVPAGANVLTATLRLTASTYNDAKSTLYLDIGAYEVKRPWVVREATWNSASYGISWGAVGCDNVPNDRLGTPSSVVRVQEISTGTRPDQCVTYDWDVTSIVQSWVNDYANQAGMLLMAPTGVYRDIAFYDSSYLGDQGAGLHPLLIVTWAQAGATATPTATSSPSLGVVTGMVFNDANRDSTRDAGEMGVAGATVRLLQGASTVAEQTTGASGSYTFNNLAAGGYTVRVIPPAGYFASGTGSKFVTVSLGQTATQDMGIFAASELDSYLPFILK